MTPRSTAAVLTAGVLALGALGALTACSDSGSDQNTPPPPPPAAFGQAHDWGGGNSVTVEGPQKVELPGPLPALVILVKVHNGSQSATRASDYRAGVDVDDSATTAAVFGVANLPQGQVQSNSDAQFPVVFEAPKPGQKLDISITGPNGLGGVTYEGAAP